MGYTYLQSILISILLLLFIYYFIIRFRQCQINYRSSVAYRDNYTIIKMIIVLIDKNNTNNDIIL